MEVEDYQDTGELVGVATSLPTLLRLECKFRLLNLIFLSKYGIIQT
jgi:hypothetical protein